MPEYAWVTLDNGRKVYRRIDRSLVASSDLPFPMIISDTMDAVQSQLDGRMYESKSLLRRTYREAGVTEVGNDPQRLAKPKRQAPDRKAIRASIERAKARLG